MDWDDLRDALNRALQSIGGEITSPWFYLQFGIILVAAGISPGLSRRAWPPAASRNSSRGCAATWPA